MKTYTFEVTIKEGNDEFWEDMNKVIPDEQHEYLQQVLEDALELAGFQKDYDFDIKRKI